MGIVLGVIAIAEAIADTIAAAGAIAATLTEAAAFAIALAIPELDIAGISSIAGVALDTGVDAAVDEGASALLQGAGRLLARKVLSTVVDKGAKKTYSNLLKIYTKAYERHEKIAKKIKTVHLVANAALNTCCLPNSGCAVPLHLKCASESASASFRGGDASFLRAGGAANSSSAWPHSLNHLGATTDLTFPMTQMCGEATQSVDSLAAATHCYEQTLRNLQLKVEMSSGWRSVSQHACNIVLFGATPYPDDGYCTVFKVPASGAALGGAHYTEMPHCATMEVATRSMLLASKTFPPDGLLPYIWAPTSTCELTRPGVRLSRILPSIPMPTPSEAVPTIALLSSIGAALLVVGVITTLMHRHTHYLLEHWGHKKPAEARPMLGQAGSAPSMRGLYDPAHT